MRALASLLGCVVSISVLAACQPSGGSSGDPVGTDSTAGCGGACASTSTFLTTADVQTVLARAVAEAKARNAPATIAVVDRVGNVLAVYRRNTTQQEIVLSTQAAAGDPVTIRSGLEGIRLPVAVAPVVIDDQAAIAKAVTGAYLSSEGNAFSTRTASQIVQENFNPGEQDQPSGPLFGVQFSQLACSDFSRTFNGVGPNVGPKRSPLGLSADPGGFPLYKNGTPVGGVGVIADGVYGIDKDILDSDADVDEAIALAATFGFAAPLDRRGDHITADGKVFRFSDVDFDGLASNPAAAPAFSTLTPADGAVVAVRGYFAGTIVAGLPFGAAASGVRPDASDFPGLDAFVLVDDANVPRFPPRDATDVAITGGAALRAAEVRQVLASALGVANRARAQIRRPVGSPARVTISVVDTLGNILGIARTRDAPMFGADVSLQKARTAAFFSSAGAAAFLQALPDAKYIQTTSAPPGVYASVSIGGYVAAARTFLGDPNALTGAVAFSDRGVGTIARPFFPDGLSETPPGPLSKHPGEWSVFSSGLQLDLSINAILQHVLFVAGVMPSDVGPNCAGVNLLDLGSALPQAPDGRLANGIQIFPGSVPIYRGNTLVGAVGVSGDGVDQDDMVAFLGLHNAGVVLGGALNHAPAARRSDTLAPSGVRLRYVQCPQAPFVDSTDTNVCDGK